MKKMLLIVWILLSVMSTGKTGKVYAKLYEGYRARNDIYLISFNGYILPAIADDLQPGWKVVYYSPVHLKYIDK